MEEKKCPTSKALAIFVWVFPITLLILIIWAVVNGKSLTTVASLATMFVASITVAGYVIKCYMKKSTLENIMLAFVRFIKCMIRLQRDNPDYELYTSIQAKKDVQYVSDMYKNEIQNTIRSTISEDVTTKIT